jgi:hypothetical protein
MGGIHGEAVDENTPRPGSGVDGARTLRAWIPAFAGMTCHAFPAFIGMTG